MRVRSSGPGFFYCGLALGFVLIACQPVKQGDLEAARKLLGSGDYPQALKAFQVIFSRNPQEPEAAEALYWVGNINYLYLDKPEAAQESFGEFLLNYPQHPHSQDVRLKVATLYADTLGNPLAAIPKYQDVIDFGPQTPEAALAQLGIITSYEKLGNRQQVITEVGIMLRNYGKSRFADRAQLLLAENYVALERYPEALQSYADLLQRYPQSDLRSSAKFGRAMALEDMGKGVEALAAYREVLPDYPNPDLVERRISRLEEQTKPDPPKARKPLKTEQKL